MLLITLRNTWARSGPSSAALRSAAPTVTSLVGSRLISTTVNALKNDVGESSVVVSDAKNIRSKPVGTAKKLSAAERAEVKARALQEQEREKEKVRKVKEKALKEQERTEEKARKVTEKAHKKTQAAREKEEAREQALKAKEEAKAQKLAEEEKKSTELAKKLREISPPFDAPPRNAFSNWLKATREEGILVAFAEQGSVWANLSGEEKKKYVVDPQLYIDYREKYKAWYKNLSPRERKAVKAKKARKTTMRPFALFVRDKFPRGPLRENQTVRTVISSITLAWKELSDAEKEVYKQRAREHTAAQKTEDSQGSVVV